MPAIHLDRLVQQINSIFEPELPGRVFHDNFISLLEVHANLAYRAGTDLQRKSLLTKYHLSPIVTHHIQQRLILLGKQNPNLALDYADQLWKDETFETKYFAALLLGSLPPAYTTEIIDRLVRWGSRSADKEIQQVLFSVGSQPIRQSNQAHWLRIIRDWVDSNDINQQITAIYAIQTTINDPQFKNLPGILAILTPLFSVNHRKVIALLSFLMNDLARTNPVETSGYLSNLILRTSHLSTKMIVQKSLKSFPTELQKGIREALSTLPSSEN